jgi:protein-S-isoprenylcysteine O-methyltransferase Ste14
MTIDPAAVVATLWAIWLAGWLLAAAVSARTVARQTVAARLAHAVFVWAGAILLFPQSAGRGALWRRLVPADVRVAWFGAAIVVAGLACTVWARVHLGRLWSAIVTVKAEHTVVRTGPYAYVRHPIYTGLIAALSGTALVRNTVAGLLGLALLVAGFILKVRQEEALLTMHLGDAYRAYRHDVPALVPRVWRRR